jgi:hypothetical protein
LVRLWEQYKNTVETDVSNLQAPGYAELAANIDQKSLAFLTLGVVATPFTTAEGAQVLLPSPEGVKQIVDAFLSDSQLLEENAIVEVQDATSSTPALASAAADYLVSLGLPQSNVTASEGATTATDTQIILFTDTRHTAERIAGWLGVSTEQIRAATPADELLRTTQADILVLVSDDADIEEVPSAESTITP